MDISEITCFLAAFGRTDLKIKLNMLDKRPRCPFLFHFGEQDPLVPPEVAEKVRAANEDAPIHVYSDAGHAFSCEPRPSYHPASARLAIERSLQFLT